MSRRLLAMLVLSLGVVGAWPLDAFACQGAGTACAATGDAGILRAYIDPGMAGFIVVAVLGFISSIGYMAREYLRRARRWLSGSREPEDAGADGEAPADGGDDGEGERC